MKLITTLVDHKDMVAALHRLVDLGCTQFSVLDDRGGSGYWRLTFAPIAGLDLAHNINATNPPPGAA